MWEVFNTWGDRGDKGRLYEAAWLGLELKRAGVRHVHAHFAGIAARTAFWIKEFWGIDYSFTGHANDIFCETDFPVSLRDLVREAKLVVTETDFSRDWLRRKFPEHSRRIERCYNGIDIGKFGPAGSGGATPRIISVGRYVEKKGFPDLIEACRILRERGVAFECDIVGGGPMEEELRVLVENAGLGSQFRLTGPRGEDEVIAMLREASVFALPCVREADGGSDNLPTVIMEAMACGLPIVSTGLAGVPEMVREGESGFWFRSTMPAVADAIRRLLADPGFASACGRRGRALVEERFITEATTRRLKHLLVARCRVRPRFASVSGDPALGLRWMQRLAGFGSRFPHD